jgi:AmiR/NasT family two-component response regulator
MNPPVMQNFRGQRALAALAADSNCARLVSTLSRLGLEVERYQPPAGERIADISGYDVVFFDADEGPGNVFADIARPDIPLIALIGIEAPSHLARVVRQRAAAYIMKPVRSSGVFTALFVAFNEQACRRREAEAIQHLERRLAGRRDLVKAIITIMNRYAVDDEDAFQRLRRESMRRRVAIDVVAREILAGPSETPPARVADRDIKRKLRSNRR